VAAALDDAHMQEGIAGPVGKLHEAEPLVGVVASRVCMPFVQHGRGDAMSLPRVRRAAPRP
jgi:hypothetical protein